jgi:hypothetical protein
MSFTYAVLNRKNCMKIRRLSERGAELFVSRGVCGQATAEGVGRSLKMWADSFNVNMTEAITVGEDEVVLKLSVK